LSHFILVEGAVIGLSIISNNIEGVSEESIKIVGHSSGYPAGSITIRDNYITGLNGPSKDAIYLEDATGILIERNRFNTNMSGSGANGVVFGPNVSEVTLAANQASLYLDPTMPGSESVPLPIDDVRAMQSSVAGGVGEDMAVGGSFTIGNVLSIKPTSTPEDPSEGDLYMDETTHKLMVYDGTTWQACW
jgi:hypothetical protein